MSGRMPPRIGLESGLKLTLALLAALGGCSRQQPDETGSVTMELRTTLGGIAYRLRDATFTVTQVGVPTPVATLDTEANPDAPSLQLSLAPGAYSIDLAPGWRLEKLIGADFQTVNATLSSQNPVPFSIVAGQTTPVAYAFHTDGTIVVIGNGTLDLTIGVTDSSVALGGIWDSPGSVWDTALWQ
jgi:hypothetical protein